MLTIAYGGLRRRRDGEQDTIDFLFAITSSSVHRIQEAQTTVYHLLWGADTTGVGRGG